MRAAKRPAGCCPRVIGWLFRRQFSGMSTVSVLTLDMNGTMGSGNAFSLFGAADTVYASPTSLYAATYSYPPPMFLEDDRRRRRRQR